MNKCYNSYLDSLIFKKNYSTASGNNYLALSSSQGLGEKIFFLRII